MSTAVEEIKALVVMEVLMKGGEVNLGPDRQHTHAYRIERRELKMQKIAMVGNSPKATWERVELNFNEILDLIHQTPSPVLKQRCDNQRALLAQAAMTGFDQRKDQYPGIDPENRAGLDVM